MSTETKNAEYRYLQQKALDILSRRDHSSQQLAQKLQLAVQRKMQTTTQAIESRYLDSITAVVEWSLSQDLLDDQRFIERFTASRVKQGYGPQRIYHDLIIKGLQREVIESSLQHSGIDWQQLAVQTATKKVGIKKLTEYKQQVKLQRFLYYRGFMSEHISAVMKKFRQ